MVECKSVEEALAAVDALGGSAIIYCNDSVGVASRIVSLEVGADQNEETAELHRSSVRATIQTLLDTSTSGSVFVKKVPDLECA